MEWCSGSGTDLDIPVGSLPVCIIKLELDFELHNARLGSTLSLLHMLCSLQC